MLLNDIPPELLMYVALYLSQNDLHSACQVCKQFYHIFTPFLYRKIGFYQNAKTELLHRSFLRRPQLFNFIKTLTLTDITSSVLFDNLSKKPSFPSLKDLTWFGQVRISDLGSVLLSAPNLKAFHGEFDFELQPEKFKLQSSCDKLFKCLLLSKSTLETLILSINFVDTSFLIYEEGISDNDRDPRIVEILLSLKEFEKLNILEGPSWMVIGCEKLSDMLPPKLVILTCARDSRPWYIRTYHLDTNICSTKIEEFLRDSNATSNLKKLKYTFDTDADNLDFEAWIKLRKEFPVLDLRFDFDDDSEDTFSGEHDFEEYDPDYVDDDELLEYFNDPLVSIPLHQTPISVSFAIFL